MNNHRHIIVAGLNGDSCAFITEPINGAVNKLEISNSFNVIQKGKLPLESVGELEDPENKGGTIKIHRIKCEIPYLLASRDHKKPNNKTYERVRTFVRS